MIKEQSRTITESIGHFVCCDHCGDAHGPNFHDDKKLAELWLQDNDSDFEEGGQFCKWEDPGPHGGGWVPSCERVTKFFHRIGKKVYCPKCVDVLIQQTKRKEKELAT